MLLQLAALSPQPRRYASPRTNTAVPTCFSTVAPAGWPELGASHLRPRIDTNTRMCGRHATIDVSTCLGAQIDTLSVGIGRNRRG